MIRLPKRSLSSKDFVNVLKEHSFADEDRSYFIVYAPGRVPIAVFRIMKHFAESFCKTLGHFGEVKEYKILKRKKP